MAEIDCDANYVVKSGDGLIKIAARATRALGEARGAFSISSSDIVDFNPMIREPNFIPAGMTIYVPCPKGWQESAIAAEETDIAASAPTPEPTPPPPPADPITAMRQDPSWPASAPLRVLTGDDYAPYAAAELPYRGFSVELVDRALRVEPGEAHQILFERDWGAHFSMLTEQSHQVSFPWFQPDCDQYAKLSPSSQQRCDLFFFSEPLHKVVVGFVARVGQTTNLVAPADLAGKIVCRPVNYFTHDLDVMGLTDGVFTLVQGETVEGCLAKLMAGEADAVTLNMETLEREIKRLGLEDQTEAAVDLGSVQSLHAIAYKGSADARARVLRLDKGLRKLRRTGDYRKIAEIHLR
ncbi:MAG: transporter substrate-binding domain-containing protein [Pseudomonadota bacterium]